MSYAPEEWRGWDSNPRSRAHEAREDKCSGRRGSRTPNGRSRTRFETGYRASGSPSRVWPAGLEPAPRRASGDRSTAAEPVNSGTRIRTSTSAFRARCPGLVRRSRKENCMSRVSSTRRCCSCHSPTLRPWIAAASLLPLVFVEAFWSPALVCGGKCAGKSSRCIYSFNYRVPAARTFLSRAGPRCRALFSSSWASPHSLCRLAFKTTKATLSDRPRFELLCRYTSSGSNPQRGPDRRRTAASRMASDGTTRRSRHRSRPSCAFRCWRVASASGVLVDGRTIEDTHAGRKSDLQNPPARNA